MFHLLLYSKPLELQPFCVYSSYIVLVQLKLHHAFCRKCVD